MELKDQLASLQSDLKGFVEKGNAEIKQLGTTTAETKSNVEKIQQQLDAIDKKFADKHANEPVKSFADELKENESVSRLLKDRRGSATIHIKAAHQMQQKTIIQSSAVPAVSPGILGVDQRPGIVGEVRPQLTLADIISSRPTSQPLISFVKVATPFTVAGMAPETTLKSENGVTFAVTSEKVRTIATFVPASRQILDDFDDLESYIRVNLPYYVKLKKEQQMLAGDGTGENLHGYIPQAVAYDTTANVVGDNKIDTIGHALEQQAESLELPPDFIEMHVRDWWKIRLQKDGYGRYILGDPQTMVKPSLFGVDVLPTTNIAVNTFLVGNSTPMASELRQRLDMEVLISTEDVDNFRKNMVTIRAEERAALIVYRPNAFRTGAFPA